MKTEQDDGSSKDKYENAVSDMHNYYGSSIIKSNGNMIILVPYVEMKTHANLNSNVQRTADKVIINLSVKDGVQQISGSTFGIVYVYYKFITPIHGKYKIINWEKDIYNLPDMGVGMEYKTSGLWSDITDRIYLQNLSSSTSLSNDYKSKVKDIYMSDTCYYTSCHSASTAFKYTFPLNIIRLK